MLRHCYTVIEPHTNSTTVKLNLCEALCVKFSVCSTPKMALQGVSNGVRISLSSKVMKILARTTSLTCTSSPTYCRLHGSLYQGIKDNQTRSVHLSSTSQGKKLPKGVPFKKSPIKFLKKGKNKEKVEVYNHMTIAALAEAMNRSTDHIYENLMFIPNTDQYDEDDSELDMHVITEIIRISGMAPQFVSHKREKLKVDKDIVRQDPPDPSVMVKRPPVVAIMGHVDHGKTTLLDKLRDSRIVDREFGGITQHIGAFIVRLENGESVCFLDTPGHAAFSAMRSRGTQMTDLVVLVVAADDGVMQQTTESINFAQEAGVPIIVAVNKIDKNNSDIERTKRMLLEHQIQLEEFGGDVQAVPISALKSINLDGLLEALTTQAEMMDLQGDPTGKVEGKVVESRLDPKRGRVATMIVQRGSLKKGDILVAGVEWAKVKAMYDDQGQLVQKATPGTPVEVMGWKGLPNAGEDILQADSESHATTVLKWRQSEEYKKKQEEDLEVIDLQRKEHYEQYKAALDARRELGFRRPQKQRKIKEFVSSHEGPSFAMLLKGDVDGSIEAITDSLSTYDSKKCQLDLVHTGVGPVTESDVELAASFDGKIYAFNIGVPQRVATLAKSKSVPIASHNIIYRLFEDVKDELNNRLPYLHEDSVIGEAKVLQVFQVTLEKNKKAYVAGSRCTSGMMSKKYGVKVIRNDKEVFKGSISSLKHFKEEVGSIKQEMECGISLSDPDFVFLPQDLIICYDIKEVSQEIDWNLGF